MSIGVVSAASAMALAGALLLAAVAQAGEAQALRAEPHPVRYIAPAAIPSAWRRQTVRSPYAVAPGTVVIDTRTRHLYLQLGDGRALRYGVAVGREGHAWHGAAVVAEKKKWPTWTPTQSMTGNAANVTFTFDGGPGNPMGARALYLHAGGRDTAYRIHGSADEKTIGRAVSSGCIRMLDQDVIDLYDRVAPGSAVHVLGASGERVGGTAGAGSGLARSGRAGVAPSSLHGGTATASGR